MKIAVDRNTAQRGITLTAASVTAVMVLALSLAVHSTLSAGYTGALGTVVLVRSNAEHYVSKR